MTPETSFALSHALRRNMDTTLSDHHHNSASEISIWNLEAYLLLPAVGSLRAVRETGIDRGKATTNDANAPSKKIGNNLGILVMAPGGKYVVGPAESTIQPLAQ